VRILIEKLVNEQVAGGDLGILAENEVSNVLASANAEATLDKIQSELEDVRAQFQTVRSLLNPGSDFQGALSTIAADDDLVTDYLRNAGNLVTNYLAGITGPASDYFTADPDAAKQAIANQLVIAFLSSAMPAAYQGTMRSFMSDPNFLLDQLMSALFDQVNRSIRDALEDALVESVGLPEDTFQIVSDTAQKLNGTVASAKVRGLPLFDGDSLRSIHLDADVKFNLPNPNDPFVFRAYMDITELNSKSTPLDCIPEGDTAVEVTLGAKDVKLNWPGTTDDSTGSALTITAEARWTLQDGDVIGLGGSLDLKGKADFEAFSLKEVGVSLAFGKKENYFAGKASGAIEIFKIPVDVEAGLFAGQACSLAPVTFVDPEAAEVLGGSGPFTGVYLEYGGGVSLSEILFGSSSCLLDIGMHCSTAVYWRDGLLGSFGGRQKMAIDASLFCLLSGHLDWAEMMRVTISPPSATIGGSADLCGKVGYCPICVHKCFGVSISGTISKTGIDYHLDY
jgi:hypothetical protein